MPKVESKPKGLAPFLSLGVNLRHGEGDEQAEGDCPFCSREGKLSVNIATGQWLCRVCGIGNEKGGGNLYTFMRLLHETSAKATTDGQLASLAANRKLLSGESLRSWGACRSIIDGSWLIPGFSAEGKLVHLYPWRPVERGGKPVLKALGGTHHGLFGVQHFDPKKRSVWLCEGFWDGVAAWELLRTSKRGLAGGIAATGVEASSLAADVNVIAVPGCNSFQEGWAKLLAGKKVYLLFDNDHPRPGVNGQAGQMIDGGALAGAKRVSRLLAAAPEHPEELHCLLWGGDQQCNPEVQHGWDVRDQLTAGGMGGEARRLGLGNLMALLKPIPEDWVPGRSAAKSKRGNLEIEPIECKSWKELVAQCRKAMEWIEGLDRAFSVMLACAASTRMPDAQLWVKVVSPPSTGKTQLCDAIGACVKYVKSTGNFSGLHSGFQTDREGEEDHSFLSRLKDMTLIIKDGDTLLKSPNREKILAQFRDAYDTNCSVSYGNKVKRDYKGWRFSHILCGTESLLELDSADLGARFLDCVIMDSIDPELESDINRRGFYRLLRNRGSEAGDRLETHDDPAMLLMKRMTAGYVLHLRENAAQLLAELDDSNADELVSEFDALAQFVAYMRARPSKRQEEITNREMSARLNVQLTKLGLCLAVVMGKRKVDEEVMRRVRKTALDTARGRTLKIVQQLAKAGEQGMESSQLAVLTGESEEKERVLLGFLRKIGALERFRLKAIKGLSAKSRWRLSAQMRRLAAEVLGEGAGRGGKGKPRR